MIFEFGATSDAIRIIQSGRGAADRDGWREIKDAAQAWRPAGYDDHQVRLRHYYEGKIEAHLRMSVKERFPFTGDRMPLVPLNWAKLYAENGASVFDYPPTFKVLVDGAAIDPDAEDVSPEDAQRARDFADMLRESQLEVTLAEAERRCVLAKSIFVRVYSDSIEASATRSKPRTKIEAVWPSDVLVIPHPLAPASLSTCVAFICRRASSDGVQTSSRAYELWTRSYVDGADGVPVFGSWRQERVTESSTQGPGGTSSTDVKIEVLTESYVDEAGQPLQLPWLAMHAGQPEGCPYVDSDRNLPALFDQVNANYMSETFAVDFASVTPLVGKTDSPTPGKVALGPGVIAWVRKGDDIQPVSVNANLEGIRKSNAALVSSVAITHRQRPEGYDAESRGETASGVALQIKNEPQTKARLEAISRAVAFVERLLAVMVETHDRQRATSIGGEGVTFAMIPAQPPQYEDPEARQRRIIDAKDAGLIDEVEARVLAGYSRTPEEARAALEIVRASRVARPNGLLAALDGMDVAQLDAPAQPATVDEVPAMPAETVADTALNGAQVSSLLEIVQAVTAGTLPKRAAQAMIAAAFPAISPAQVAAIIGPVDEGSAAPEGEPAPGR